MLVSAFLAGAYIAFGGLVAITVSSGLDPETWGTLPTLFTGAAFTLGLVLVLIAGSDLATGNMMLVPLGAMRGKIGVGDVARNLTLVLLGNLLGALLVAYFLAVQTGVIGDAGAERQRRADLRAAGLDRRGQGAGEVGLADVPARRWAATGWSAWRVWMSLAATAVSGQDPRDLLPDHGVRGDGLRPRRRQHVLPAGRDLRGRARTSAGARRCSTGCSPGAGNLVGAVVFVSTSYWYLFLKDQPDEQPDPAGAESAERA